MLSSGRLDWAGIEYNGQGEILREIDDPHNGDRWLLIRNDQYPGGPGRLVRIAIGQPTSEAAMQQSARQAEVVLVIHSGDRLTVEEHTPVVDAVLEARALRPAAAGAVFEVRLAIGGKVVRAVALGPGRAALEPERGVQP
jgi:hypothetical protein